MSDTPTGTAGAGANAAPETVTVGAEFGDHDAADAIRRGLLTDLGDLAPSETPKDSADEAEDGDGESRPTGEKDEGHSEADEPNKAPTPIEPPKSWSDDNKKLFSELPPAAQAVIAQRETEREAAFTRSQKETATERAAAQAVREAAQKETAVYQENLQKLALAALPDMAEFAKLQDPVWAAQYPADAVVLQSKFLQFQARMGAIQQEQQRISQAQQQEQQKRQGEMLASERVKLVERIPDFADPEKGKALSGELSQFLHAKGFTADEIGNVIDHRVVALAVNAMRSEQADAARKTAEATRKAAELKATPQTAPRVQKPGTAPENPRDAMNSRDKEMTQRFFGADKVTDRDAAEMIKRGLGL